MAAVALKLAGVRLSGKLVIGCVADEEGCGKYGTEWLRSSGQLKPDLLVIGEQTANHIAIAERQLIWVKINVEGRACHAALPWKGENAIVRMGYVIKEINEWLAPRLEKRKHPYLPHSTVNIALVKGGIKENVVPDMCSIVLDRRLHPNEDCSSVFGELETVIKRVQKRVARFPYGIELVIDQGPTVNTSPNDEFVKVMQSVSGVILKTKMPLIGYAQGSDGRWFARDGIPIVIFGPSDPSVAHSDNEGCPVDELVSAARILALTAIRILCNDKKG